MIVFWIDDNLICRSKENVANMKRKLIERFDCEDCGEFDKFLGNKITKLENGVLKMTRPVLVQKFEDEFEIPTQTLKTLGRAGNILTQGDKSLTMNAKVQTYFRSGVGILIHLMQWSRPDTCNAVRDCARHSIACNELHIDAMHRIMKYCIIVRDHGKTLNPGEKWSRSKDFKFKI